MRLTVCSRKGLFAFDRGSQGWTLQQHDFPGEPVTAFVCDAGGQYCLAALRLGQFGVKLRRSLDGGRTWSEAPAPAFPEKPEHLDDPHPWSVDQVWTLEGLHDRAPERIWAGTIPGGLFRSDDRGETWSLNPGLWNMPQRRQWFGGGYDNPGIHSIAVSSMDPDDLLVGVSCGGVWRSVDAGENWQVGTGMVASYMPPERASDPGIQDPHRVVRCRAAPEVLWAQHHCGVWRSTDSGQTWISVDTVKPSVFGFAVAVDPNDPQRAWFVPAISDTQRIPVGASLAVGRTSDGGVSCEVLQQGLPQRDAYHLVYRHALAVSPDGRWLAMGSTTGALWVSESGGQTWVRAGADLPPIFAVHWT
jgi:BNR/Asp-box repeat